MSADALVLTPYSWDSPAIQLSSRMWRKKVLPLGDVEYQGRTLHFGHDYLSTLVNSFRSGAYDQVSFQLADAKNAHTNDPERHRGTITGLELGEDGLYATAQVTEAGERVLAENPMLGVSARIVEHYNRSDGKYFPAAIQHILGTLDPRVPGLGAWSPVDMSNSGGQVIIDLSNAAWWGEPGPSLDLAASAVGARLGAAPQYGDADIDAIIAASLPQDYGHTELAEFDWVFQLANETELARLAEDAVPLAARTEDRLARALDRIEAGTYTPRGQAAWGFAAHGEGTVTGMPTCGSSDEYGYCRERYHAPGCGSTAGPDIVENLRPQLERIALQPHLGDDGRVWHDRQFGSPMTLTDHIEASTGIRLGDKSLWERDLRDARGNRREVAQVQRPQVFGDPDDADALPLPVAASTARTAEALARQAGLPTSASHQEQHAAAVREHDRQAARYRGPRHMDYRTDLSNPAPRDTGLTQFGDAPWNGSLPVYSLAGTA
jgi:hypothetical protein